MTGCGVSQNAVDGLYDGGSRGGGNLSSSAPSAGVADLKGSLTSRPVYRIGPSDVLKIAIFQADDLSRTVQVGDNGLITMPLIGSVQAAGRTAQEVEVRIASLLKAKYLQSPQVTVFIDQYNSQKVTVSGAVKKPGVYPVRGKLSLQEAIATAEGLDNVADASDVLVFREVGGQRVAVRFDLNRIRSGVEEDPLLQAGDIVAVESSGVKTALRDYAAAFGTFSVLSSAATFATAVK